MDLLSQHQGGRQNEHASVSTAEAKARLLSWAYEADAEKAAAGKGPLIMKTVLFGGAVLLAGSVLKKAGIKRVASLLFVTRGLPFVLRHAAKETLASVCRVRTA